MAQSSSPMKLIKVSSEDRQSTGDRFLTANSEIEGDIKLVHVLPLEFQLLRTIFAVFFGIVFALLPLIFARWNLGWRRKMFYGQLSTTEVSKATHFMLHYNDGSQEIVNSVKLQATRQTVFEERGTTGFIARKLRYVLDIKTKLFVPLETTLFKNKTVGEILGFYNIPLIKQEQVSVDGLTKEESERLRDSFGRCLIDIDIPPLLAYMAEEMTAPLYFVQYLAVFVWFLEKYFTFAILMICFTTLLTIVNYLFFRSSMIKLREKAIKLTQVKVYRQASLGLNNIYSTQPENKALLSQNNVVNRQMIAPNANDVSIEMGQLNAIQERQGPLVINSDQLVPGDILVLRDNMMVPCDCVLLTGEVFVNEVTLTGESLPVPKSEIDSGSDGAVYYIEDQKANVKSILFEGTQVIKTRPSGNRVHTECLALVQRTGFCTFKGQIFRSLVFVRTKTALFQITAGKFIALLASVGFIGCMAILFQFIQTGLPGYMVAIKIADMIIFIAPPAIPIMTTFCLTMSLARLRINNIFGINPQSLLAACKVTTCCFDKTGTLTDLHLDFNNVVLSNEQSFAPSEDVQQKTAHTFTDLEKFTTNPKDLSYYLFSTCHSIIYDSDGTMLGDPLDIKMFEVSSSELPKIQNGPQRIKFPGMELLTLRTFPFSSDDQCMSVVIQHSKSHEYLSLVKGSPEKLRRISKAETVPNDFDNILNGYTMQGLRVLGMGYKSIPQETNISTLTRAEVESDLRFVGFIVFINRLKHDTAAVLARLKACDYSVKMISGDNSLTCAQTAKNANIVASNAQFIILEQEKDIVFIREIQERQLVTLDQLNLANPELRLQNWLSTNVHLQREDREFVINGQVLESFLNICGQDEKPLLALISKAALFGRCRPEHKAQVVKALRRKNIVCAMVGDGANDCPAIKAADLGISFAETDASISAPFSSMNPSISCVERIIMEGKCTTQNSIEALRYYATTGLYKFVACGIMIFTNSWYSETQLTFMSYYLGTIIFNVFFGLNAPMQDITFYQPNDNLVSPYFVGTFFVHTLIGGSGFVIIYLVMVNQNWYIEADVEKGKLITSGMVNSSLLGYASILTVTTLAAMYFGKPFKQPIYKNYLLTSVMIAKVIWVIVFVIRPKSALKSLTYVAYEEWFGWVILGVSLAVFVLLYTTEQQLQQSYLRSMMARFKKFKPKSP